MFICGMCSDLIRHGKHHQAAAREQKTSDPDSSRSPVSLDTPRGSPRQQQQQATHELPNDVQFAEQSRSPDHREAAEMIVNEEREASTKMPTYVGLENFKLVDKMGE